MIRTLAARTHAGEIEVALLAPYGGTAQAHGPIPTDLFAALSELEGDGDELEEDRHAELQDEAVRRFAESPEAKELDDVHGVARSWTWRRATSA